MSEIVYANSPFAEFINQVSSDIDVSDENLIDDSLFSESTSNSQSFSNSKQSQSFSFNFLLKDIYFHSFLFFKTIFLNHFYLQWWQLLDFENEHLFSTLYQNINQLDDEICSKLFQLFDSNENSIEIETINASQSLIRKSFKIFIAIFLISIATLIFIIISFEKSIFSTILLITIIFSILISISYGLYQVFSIRKIQNLSKNTLDNIKKFKSTSKSIDKTLRESIQFIQETELLFRGYKM